MRRTLTLLYALFAALVLAGPLAASEQPPADQAVAEAVVPPVEPEALSAGPPPEPPAAEATQETQETQETQPVLAKAAPGTVTISDFEFAPVSVTVNVGDTVTWSNAGPTPHSATGDNFDTEVFDEGESRSHTFSEAGEFAYICTPHPQMKGTVIVQAAAAQGEGEGGSSDTGTGTGGDAGVDGSTAADAGTASGSASTATLPATGLDAGGLLALGLITLALGAFLRRRSAATG